MVPVFFGFPQPNPEKVPTKTHTRIFPGNYSFPSFCHRRPSCSPRSPLHCPQRIWLAAAGGWQRHEHQAACLCVCVCLGRGPFLGRSDKQIQAHSLESPYFDICPHNRSVALRLSISSQHFVVSHNLCFQKPCKKPWEATFT